jgi:tRNA nucleotidyltransferase (CCA-adding enzyme)
VEALCERLKAPNRFRELAMSCTLYHGYTHRLYELRPKTVVKLLMGLDAFRRPERLRQFLLVCEADYRGRKGFHARPYPQAADLWYLYQAASGVRLKPDEATDTGWLRGEAVRRERVRRVAAEMPVIRAREGSATESVEDAETGDIGTDGGAQGTEKEDQQDA